MKEEKTSAGDVIYLLEHIGQTFHRQTDQVLQERLGIGMSQYRIIDLLQDKPRRQRDLADALGQTEAAISRQIVLLVEQGLAISSIHPERKRERVANITPKGIKLTIAARDILEHYTEPLLGDLTGKQQQSLLDALTILHRHTCRPNKPFACKQ